jgi:hypothetical protein
MVLLSIDPGRSFKGEKTIGWALFFTDARPPQKNGWVTGEISFEGLIESLDIEDGLWWSHERKLTLITEVVIEDFVNNSQSKGGQRNGTSECIGAVEFACIKTDTPFTRQRADRLVPAKLHAGYVDTHKHLPHQDSAYLHGYYYLVGKGILTPKGLADTL